MLLALYFMISTLAISCLALLYYLYQRQILILKETLSLKMNAQLDEIEKMGKLGRWECNQSFNYFYCSKGFRALLGLSHDNDLNYPSFIHFIHTEDRKVFVPALEEALFTQQPFSCSFRVSLSPLSFRWLQTEGKPEFDEKGQFQKMVCVAHDITEKIQSDEAYFEATMRAETANRTKARFLANMSHEIRTPMNGIIGLTNLLLSSKIDSNQTEKLKLIQNCSNDLLDLINDVLDFSKLEVDKLELEFEPFSPHQCTLEIIELFHTKAHEKNNTIKYQPPIAIPHWITGDSTRFRQILTNLISNALKFTQNGSVFITTHAQLKENDKYEFRYSVQDTGIGIPEEVKGRLFQSFSQVDASTTRKFGGTGLGLAISKGICEKMGGTIWVDSQINQGSTFTFTFLAQTTSAPEISLISDPFHSVDLDLGKKKPLSILVAEDNKINQIVATGLLEKLGYPVDIAENGAEVLVKLKKKSYDLIFMDCHMPILDGFETTKKICEEYLNLERPRIVALTASTMKSDFDLCKKCGMDDVIIKPVQIKDLVKVLEVSTRRKANHTTISHSPHLNDEEKFFFDFKRFQENYSDLSDSIYEIFEIFFSSSEKLLNQIKEAIHSRDAKALKISAHTLRGVLSHFYVEEAIKASSALELNDPGEDFQNCDLIFLRLQKECQKLTHELKKIYENRKSA